MIYIVEDDASIRELEQYALQTNSFPAQGFADGASFWAAVRQAVPALVVHPRGAGDHGHRQNQRD